MDDLAEAVAEFGRLATKSWTAAPAPAVRLLPANLPFEALPAPSGGQLPIGVAEADLQPVSLNFDAEPHVLLFGDIESGKSSFLRSLAKMVTTAYDPSQARIIVVDYRRSLLGSVETSHLIGYGTSQQTTVDLISQVTTVMRDRLPGPEVTTEQLRNRSWWQRSGPVPAHRRLRPGQRRGPSTRSHRCWSTCRRPATSACTW